MMRQRVVAVEMLDTLPVDDPRAIRSRCDLRRIHTAMASRRTIRQALDGMHSLRPTTQPIKILELGAGDGTLMLEVARALSPRWPAVEITLLDRLALTSTSTRDQYAAIGWTVCTHTEDVFGWVNHVSGLPYGQGPHWDLIVANLFLHHFTDPQLAALLSAVSNRCRLFFACEPRRAGLALVGSHLVGALGANAVTREDAVLSVRAGFRNQELTALWPNPVGDWQTTEYSAGLFSHCLRADRSVRT